MRILMIVCLSFCAGAAAALLPLPSYVFYRSAGLLLLLALVLLGLKRERRLTLIFLGLGLGLLFSNLYQTAFTSPARSLDGQTVFLTGTAEDYGQPSAHGLWVESKLDTEAGVLRADVFLPHTDWELKPGDHFSGTFSLSDSALDGDFYGYSEGLFLTAFGKKDAVLSPCDGVPRRYFPRWIAHKLESSVNRCFPGDVSGYAMALTTGNRSGLTDLQKANLKTSGIYHALALSGMHMAVLIAMISMLVRRKRRRAIIGIPVCILFALVTGASPSVVRACLMQCLLLLADSFRRESDWPTSLSLALLLLTAQNPWCLMNWGLQLSFLSVVGICCFNGRLYSLFLGKKRKKRGLLQRLRKLVAAGFSVTLSAMTATFPLMLAYFGSVSLISPVTNLLTGTVIMLCFGGSLLTALVGLALPALGGIMGWVIAWGFRYTDFMASQLSRVPFASLYTDSFFSVLCLILVYGVLLFLLFGRKKIIPVCCGLSGFAVCILLILLDSAVPAFTALDVGQGQCLIFSGYGSAVMVDCGGNEGNAGDTAAEYLRGRGIQEVALLLLTHFDSDHVDGVPELLSRVSVGRIVFPDVESDARAEIEALAERLDVPCQAVASDLTAGLGNAQFQIFAPVDQGNDNDQCLSIRAQLPSLSVLATGDMDMTAEEKLIASHSLQADILVAGHHGSKYSTSALLLEAASPQTVVISVGDNSYGHPAQETLDRVQEAGAQIARTDELGTIRYKGESHWQR